MSRHTCIATAAREYRKMASAKSDDEMVNMFNGWDEFKKPMFELTKEWRRFCQIMRQEAHRRGLAVKGGV